MSLNWKEIDLILSELDLAGSQVQKVFQSAFDVLGLQLHGKTGTRLLLIALSPGACRLHETARGMPKNEKPLRFAEFLKSRLLNGRIEEALQLGDNRIVRFLLRRGETHYRMYIRLWSNAANVVVTDEAGTILDAMRRQPKKGEITGGHYAPEETLGAAREAEGTPEPGKEAAPRRTREFTIRELPGPGSFNEKIGAWYTEHNGALSLDSLREQVSKTWQGSIDRLRVSLDRLREKEADYVSADRLREYGDLILANLGTIKPGDPWLETERFPAQAEGAPDAGSRESIRIKLDTGKTPVRTAEQYYEQYRKARKGLADVQEEIRAGEAELFRLETAIVKLLGETNPLVLHGLLKNRRVSQGPPGAQGGKLSPKDRKRPGLSFRDGDWLLLVGRDGKENDELLRRHVKGNDLWLHVRDYPGSYVFIKQRSGKTVPLEILLDAGNLALFYSKGRNNAEGDLFYTPVKFLRRAKQGPRGLVIPTQEKNLHIKMDDKRLKTLESCRIIQG
ncbi:hypothetical protein FACS189468_6810 [Spirochaetia bacterium]|nr:hypothetical protein FACS189468_6810 [Spirochaetia bacterium]